MFFYVLFNTFFSCPFSFADAVFAATAAPAALLGLSHIGSLRVGARADLLLLDGEGKRGDLPARVMQCGEWLA